jgi:adenine-specific DNA-methyltransferase
MQLEPEFINLLLSNENIKDVFFTEINNVLVFDKVKFNWAINNKQFLPDSYTKYKNKIGLSANDYDLITENKDISLVFPYKDSILEGGQTDDEEQKDEVFYNEVLAFNQVRNLLSPKALANAKRYTGHGVEETTNINKKDNLIIKGNNLLALSSLLENYRNEIKLIYIDPPYNTGSDSFHYNDKFNHSTWLTFMKNRLEIAKELLKDNGLIFVQCDDNEQAYLKILMDDIFKEENFINVITIKTKIGGVSGSSAGKSIRDATEFINIFAKDKNSVQLNPSYTYTPLYQHIKNYKDNNKSWKYTSVITELSGKKHYKTEGSYEYYTYDSFESKSVARFAKDNGITEEEVYTNHADKIFRTTNAQSSVRQTVINETEHLENEVVGLEYVPIKGKDQGNKIEILYKNPNRNMFMFLSDVVEFIENKPYYYENITTLWDDIEYNNLSKEGNISFKNGKKPEQLLKRIIEVATNEGDIVLDFFMGSGTTQAVAHKMNRQYIGIEQMEYINSITVPRLQDVIKGEQNGVSKSVNWQGGGSFVYFELKELNDKFVKEIGKASETNELKSIYKELKEKGLLIPSLETRVLENKVDFNDLTFEQQKEVVLLAIDKNKLYVNASQIDDKEINLSDYEKELTMNFYGKDSSNDTRQGTLSI